MRLGPSLPRSTLALCALSGALGVTRVATARAGGSTAAGGALSVPPPAPAPPPPPPAAVPPPRQPGPPPSYAPPRYGAPAYAYSPRPSVVAPPVLTSTEKDTYSGQIVLADGLSFGAILPGARMESAPLVTAGIVGYFAGGPLVHGAHGRGATAGARLGLRVLTPLIIGGVFYGIASSGSKECHGSDAECGDFQGLSAAMAGVGGGVLGAILAPILDASLLARREWFDALPVVPAVGVSKGGGRVGLGGVF